MPSIAICQEDAAEELVAEYEQKLEERKSKLAAEEKEVWPPFFDLFCII